MTDLDGLRVLIVILLLMSLLTLVIAALVAVEMWRDLREHERRTH